MFGRFKPIIWLAILAIIIIFSSINLRNVFSINQWSLQFARQAFGFQDVKNQEIPAPENHQRSSKWLAREAIKKNDPDRAIQLVESLAEDMDVDALMITGEALLAKKDFAGAVENMVSAKNSSKILDIASQAEEEGDYSNASKGFIRAYDLNPENSTIHYVKFMERNNQDPKDIEELLEDSLENFPQSEFRSVWLQKMGDVLYEQERWEEAIRAYEESITLNPNMGESYFGLAQVFVAQGKYTEADEWFQEAINKNPENQWWLLQRANTARDAGKIKDSIGLYEQLVHRFPDFAQAYSDAAWAYRLDNKPDLAISAIQAAIIKSKTPKIWYFIRAGKIYEWAGDYENAINAYEKALDINSKNKTAINGLKSLEK